jgi:hypothetical protein
VLGYAAIELLPMNHVGYLRENETAGIHARQSQQGREARKSNSNASQQNIGLSPWHSLTYESKTAA